MLNILAMIIGVNDAHRTLVVKVVNAIRLDNSFKPEMQGAVPPKSLSERNLPISNIPLNRIKRPDDWKLWLGTDQAQWISYFIAEHPDPYILEPSLYDTCDYKETYIKWYNDVSEYMWNLGHCYEILTCE